MTEIEFSFMQVIMLCKNKRKLYYRRKYLRISRYPCAWEKQSDGISNLKKINMFDSGRNKIKANKYQQAVSNGATGSIVSVSDKTHNIFSYVFSVTFRFIQIPGTLKNMPRLVLIFIS